MDDPGVREGSHSGTSFSRTRAGNEASVSVGEHLKKLVSDRQPCRASVFHGTPEKSISEEEVVEREGSRIQSCQVLVFSLRCDKLSQLKRAVKCSLQQQALSPCKSGQSSAQSSSASL